MSEQQAGNAAGQSLQQARVELDNGNAAAAITHVRQAVTRSDVSANQLAEAASLAANLNLEEAFTWFMRAGRRQFDDGNLEGARATFEAARVVDAKNYEPIFELGRIEIASGNQAEGLGRFAEVLRKSNYTFVPALFEAGCAYEAEDDIDRAILTFKRIVERDKSHAQGLAHLGRLYRTKQMATEATMYLLSAAEAARKIMDYALALQCARDILEFDPGNARANGLEAEMQRILPEPRERPKPAPKEPPKPAPPPPPPPVQQVAAAIVPSDFKLIEQQSKATLELAQVTAAVAEAYKQRLAIEEQIKSAQATLESLGAERAGADQELTAIKTQLDNVAKARAAEEASLAALSAKLDHTRQGLAAIETLHESVKQADEQAGAVASSIDQLRSESAGVKAKAEKAKSDAVAVEKALNDVATSFAALRKEAEGAKAVLDEAKAQAEKAKAEAAAAEATATQARAKYEAASGKFDEAEKLLAAAAERAKAVGGDASAALAGVADIDATLNATVAAQKSVAEAVGQLRALANALTERRKQTEAALSSIQSMSGPAAGLTDSDIAKLEAGLAAAIEKAATAAKATQPPPAPAPKTAPPQPVAAKGNGPVAAAPAQPAAKGAPAGKGEKQAEKAAEKAKQAESPAQTAFARGMAALEAKKPQDALKLFEPIANDPEFAVRAQTAIGRCYQQMGDHDEAIARYSKALELPGHPEDQYHEALYHMADAHASREDSESLELAVWALEEIAAANPKYRDVTARIASLKADAGKAATRGPA